LKAKIGFNLASYPGDTDAVAQILIGRSDVVLTQDTSAAYQIGKHPGKLLIAYLFSQQDSFGIYYRKGDAALAAGLRDAVSQLKKNGTMRKLAAKYKLPAADVK
jgi:ABC-type amino acid transport substrate-binding protein